MARKVSTKAKKTVSAKKEQKPVEKVKKPEVKADCECKCACKTSASKLTRVLVKYNAGWGNQLFIRGTGAGLDWQKGVPMQCVGEDEWLWEQLVSKGNLSFKILVNDQAWNQGDDIILVAGDSITVHPIF